MGAGSALPSRQTRRQSIGDTTGPSTVCGGVSLQEKLQLRRCCWNAFLQSLIYNPHGPSCFHCASARANSLLRVVKPEATRAYSQRHNEGFVEVPLQDLARGPRTLRTMRKWQRPCHGIWGGNGVLRDALRVATPAYWANWGRLHAHDLQEARTRGELVHARTGRSTGRSFWELQQKPVGQ